MKGGPPDQIVDWVMGSAKEGIELAQKTGKQVNQNEATTEDDSWWDGTLDFLTKGWGTQNTLPPDGRK